MNKEDVAHIAKLSRLSFSDQELENFTGRFNEVLTWVEQLKEVDTQNTPPMAQPTPLTNVWREDALGRVLTHEQVFMNTQHEEEGCFEVPAVLAEEEP